MKDEKRLVVEQLRRQLASKKEARVKEQSLKSLLLLRIQDQFNSWITVPSPLKGGEGGAEGQDRGAAEEVWEEGETSQRCGKHC